MNLKAIVIGMTIAAGPLGALKAQTPAPSKPLQSPAAPGAAPSPQKAPPTDPSKVVMRVGGQEVTAGDLDLVLAGLPLQTRRVVTAQGPRKLGEQYALMVALSQRAVADHLDRDPQVQKALLLQRAEALAKAEYQQLEKDAKVTPTEISQYYQSHKAEFAQIEVRQIAARKAAKGSTPPGLSPEQAQARLDEIRKALLSGADAAKVEQQFRQPDVVFLNLKPQVVRRGQYPPQIDQKLFAAKDGDFVETVNDAQVISMIQVLRHSFADLKTVSSEIDQKLQNEKLQSAIGQVKQQANIWMDPGYFAPPKPTAPPKAGTPTRHNASRKQPPSR